MRRSMRSVDPDEADSILRAMGFTRRAGKGDHRVYSHPDLPWNLVIDPRRPLLPAYVRQIIRAIEAIEEVQE